jgi:N-acetyl-anhydromuramyl-L-alanine amidase AmpD
MFSPLVDRIIRAKNFTRNAGRSSGAMRVVVIHTMESPEGVTTAEDVSNWAAGPTAPKASWHYAVDSNSIVGCVDEEDVAWAAPGANHDGVQIELAGKAGQTAQQWADDFSRAELVLAAKLVADICKRREIDVRKLTNAQLADGRSRGVIGHVQASEVFKRSTHTDPGTAFPWEKFMRDVKALMPDSRRWQVRLVNGKGDVVDRSMIVGTAGLAARVAAFSARVAGRFARMAAAGEGPRIRTVRVSG